MMMMVSVRICWWLFLQSGRAFGAVNCTNRLFHVPTVQQSIATIHLFRDSSVFCCLFFCFKKQVVEQM